MADAVAAATRALVCWLFFYYGFIAHCLVIWKWQTPDIALEDPTLVIAEVANQSLVETRLQLDEQLQQLDAVSTQLQQATQSSQQRNIQWKRTLQQWQNQYHEAVATLAELRVAPEDEVEEYTPFVGHLRHVLMRTNLLVEQPDEEVTSLSSLPLAELLDLATEELDAIEWTTLQKFIINETASFPKIRQPIANAKTASVESCVNYTFDAVAVETALEAQQQYVVRQFMSQTQNATLSMPLSFPATLSRLQDILHTRLANATRTLTSRIRDATTNAQVVDSRDETTVVDQCGWSNDQGQVLTWLEAGLEALAHQRDLRTALLQALADDDIDVSGLILDAELPSATAATTDPVSARTLTTLRQLLDTPTLHESSILVDWLLQWINGRHDGLDDFLDRRVYAHVNESTKIGPLAVEQLLRLAGRVELPPAIKTLLSRTQAGVLRG